MKRLLTIILILSSLMTLGQSWRAGKLKEEVNIDKLFVSAEFTYTANHVIQKELLILFDSMVSVFNKEEQAFTLIVDSTRNNRTIRILVGPIKYVDWKKNLWVTGLDLALIGANILILPYFRPIIPCYMMPATTCRVGFESSDDLFYKPTKLFVNPHGYFTKR